MHCVMLHIITDVLQKAYPKHEGCITSVYFQNYSLCLGKVKKIYFMTQKIYIVRKEMQSASKSTISAAGTTTTTTITINGQLQQWTGYSTTNMNRNFSKVKKVTWLFLMEMKMEVGKWLSTKIHSHDNLEYHVWKSCIILSLFVCLFSFLLYMVKVINLYSVLKVT